MSFEVFRDHKLKTLQSDNFTSGMQIHLSEYKIAYCVMWWSTEVKVQKLQLEVLMNLILSSLAVIGGYVFTDSSALNILT